MRPKTVVLVVEDEPLVRISIADELERAGFVIIEAESAAQAIQVLELGNDIRIVFSDIHLDGSMDGLELLRLIASRWPPVRLFATSGAVTLTDAELPDGAKFFPKPYNHLVVVDAFKSEFPLP